MLIKNTTLLFILIISSYFTLFTLKHTKQDITKQFQDFKTKFNKNYTSKAEEHYRRAVFTLNIIKINNHNQNQSNLHREGVTKFADLTQQQFKQTYLEEKYQLKQLQVKTVDDAKFQRNQTFVNVDWTVEGHVSKVKDQGACRSDWAFSATSAIESAYSIFKNKKVLLSEQQLLDCSAKYGTRGCDGGWAISAYAYTKDHGLSTEGEYPYIAMSQRCYKDQGDYKIKDFKGSPGCSSLYEFLQLQPAATFVDASNWAFYVGGIMWYCGTQINHGVLVVGVNDQYWKVKNSWGVNWGQQGYIRLASGNTCSICSYSSYPVL